MSPVTTEYGESLTVTAVIPAFFEEKTIGKVVESTSRYVDEVIVVDDGSADNTSKNALESGARVIKHPSNRGVLAATRSGFVEATGDIIVTLDADGQHDPNEIPSLIQPIMENEADLVIGTRAVFPHVSEKILTKLTNLKVGVKDACSGYRAIRGGLAKKMNLHGACLCGTLILEGYRRKARIVGVPITVRSREECYRRIRSRHTKQFFILLKDLFEIWIGV